MSHNLLPIVLLFPLGQEEGVVGQDGEIRITPFNMQEELEEGHFDKEGMYHWKKEKDVQDNWLENIDWCKVNETTYIIVSYILSYYTVQFVCLYRLKICQK